MFVFVVFHSFGHLAFHYVNILQFIHSTLDGHLDNFKILEIGEE